MPTTPTCTKGTVCCWLKSSRLRGQQRCEAGRTSQGEGWGHSLEKMGAFFAERARGGVGLMVTGGIAPNAAGRVAPFAATMASSSDARRHRTVTEMVHEARGGCGDAAARLPRAGGGSPPFRWRASRWAAQRLRCSCCTRGGAPNIPI